MNVVDVIVLAIVAFSGMLGFLRGMVREVLGLAAWVGAAFAAWWFFPKVQPLARQVIANPDIADPVAFGAVFLFVLIVLSLVARSLGGAVRRSALGGLDRTLGLVYGLARGAAVWCLAYLMAGAVEPVDRWPDAVLEARLLPSIYQGAAWVAQRLPDEFSRHVVTAPPAGRLPLRRNCCTPIRSAGRWRPAVPPVGERPHGTTMAGRRRRQAARGMRRLRRLERAGRRGRHRAGLHALQHRGQEATGIVSFDGQRFHQHRGLGLVGDNFGDARVIASLPGRTRSATTATPPPATPSCATCSRSMPISSSAASPSPITAT